MERGKSQSGFCNLHLQSLSEGHSHFYMILGTQNMTFFYEKYTFSSLKNLSVKYICEPNENLITRAVMDLFLLAEDKSFGD